LTNKLVSQPKTTVAANQHLLYEIAVLSWCYVAEMDPANSSHRMTLFSEYVQVKHVFYKHIKFPNQARLCLATYDFEPKLPSNRDNLWWITLSKDATTWRRRDHAM